MMLALLLIGMVTLAFNIQPAKGEWTGTVYIRADGSIDPPSAPISTVDDVTYTLTGNITSDADGIVVERDHIVIDGAGYTIQGPGSYPSRGIDLSRRTNVTVRNIHIKSFSCGIYLFLSSNYNSITGNGITNNGDGIELWESSNNSISGNNITNNSYEGIVLVYSSNNNSISGNSVTNNYIYGITLAVSSNNSISGNTITNNIADGIGLWDSSNYNSMTGNNITSNDCGICLGYSSNNNSIAENIIADNGYGIWLESVSNNNFIFHNDFKDNTEQVYSYASTNVWDDGYPSGGNYWSDYEDRYPDAAEIDDSGIWNTPYEIDEDNQDNYPLMEPYSPLPRTIDELESEIEELGSDGEVDNQGVVTSLLAKLEAAQTLIADEKIDRAKFILNAFINEVQAQSGKHMTADAAELLLQAAEYILSNL